MLHVLLDEWIGERAVTQPVTVLFLLGLWLFVFPALVWMAGYVIWSTSTLGRASFAFNVRFHPLTPR